MRAKWTGFKYIYIYIWNIQGYFRKFSENFF